MMLYVPPVFMEATPEALRATRWWWKDSRGWKPSHGKKTYALKGGRKLEDDPKGGSQLGRILANKVLEFSPEMKVLMMSGYTEELIAGEGTGRNLEHLLQKPFSAFGVEGVVAVLPREPCT